MRKLCISLLALAATMVSADDWPQWRGSNRDGNWNETKVIDRFEEDQLEVSWRQPLGAGYSGPTV
ncbi:MAG: dehydrogenase, partial [Limisphaerales bacterium]